MREQNMATQRNIYYATIVYPENCENFLVYIRDNIWVKT